MMAERDEDKHFLFVLERGLLLKTKKKSHRHSHGKMPPEMKRSEREGGSLTEKRVGILFRGVDKKGERG
jgi:hypothetical protein